MSSTVDSIRQIFRNMQGQYGKIALNALFPNEFEVYILALELVNGNGEVEEYFVFPINPSNLVETDRRITNIKKTLGGVSILGTTNYVPQDISLQGTFGKKFKFLVGSDIINFAGLSFSFKKNRFKTSFNSNLSQRELSSQIKTGYGCYKVLQAVCSKSEKLDDNGKPYTLYFYNLALGSSYMVKVVDLTSSMSETENMLWKYNLSLKAVAPIDQVRRRSMLNVLKATAAGTIQNKINGVFTNFKTANANAIR